MTLFCPLTWKSEDEEQEDGSTKHVLTAFGRLDDGRSICVRFHWSPRFFIAAPPTGSEQSALLNAFPKRNKQASVAMKRVPIYGFCNNRQDTFLCLAFDSLKAFRTAKWKVTNDMHMMTYEAAVDPVAQFMDAINIKPVEWLLLSHPHQVPPSSKASNCDVEVILDRYSQISQAPVSSSPPVPSWVLGSWDLETFSDDGRFPNPANRSCPIIQIGLVINRYQQAHFKKYIITTTPCDAVDGVEIIEAGSEGAAIQTFASLILQHQVDVLVAWNGFGFDNHYLFTRAEIHDLDINMAKIKDAGMGLTERSIGGRDACLLMLPGILQYDPMYHLRSENRFDSYKLDSVASQVTGANKVDLPPHELFRLHREGTSSGQASIALYCAVDCELPLKIMEKLALLPNVIALSNATRTAAQAILTNGQVSDSSFTLFAHRLNHL